MFIQGAYIQGITALPVAIAVRLEPGPPGLRIEGLGEAAAREISILVREALRTVDLTLDTSMLVQIFGSDAGASGLDLAIALAIVAELKPALLPPARLPEFLAVGHLSLSGRIKSIRGAIATYELARRNGRRLILPAGDNLLELLCAVGNPDGLYPATTLSQIIEDLRDDRLVAASRSSESSVSGLPDFDELPVSPSLVQAIRELERAVIGRKNVLLVGSPAAGKTMLARRIPSIMPTPTADERLEIACVHSAAGIPMLSGVTRPFRVPHHTISLDGLFGGGFPIRPGEVTLAHKGVLFLDDAPEFRLQALLELRSVVSTRTRLVTKRNISTRLPADFMLVGATTSIDALAHDRLREIFDVVIEVDPIGRPGADGSRSESSAVIRNRVEAALADLARSV